MTYLKSYKMLELLLCLKHKKNLLWTQDGQLQSLEKRYASQDMGLFSIFQIKVRKRKSGVSINPLMLRVKT